MVAEDALDAAVVAEVALPAAPGVAAVAQLGQHVAAAALAAGGGADQELEGGRRQFKRFRSNFLALFRDETWDTIQ